MDRSVRQSVGLFYFAEVQSKPAVVRSFAYRCIRISSSPRLLRLLQLTLVDLKRILLLNGYPVGTVKYHMNDVIEKHQNTPKDLVQTVRKKEVLIAFLGHHSKHLTKQSSEVLY